jgi:hypothetical protein
MAAAWVRACFGALLLVVSGVWVTEAQTCPFCIEGRGPTIIDDMKLADFVVLGTFSNARLDRNGENITDFTVERVFKSTAKLPGQLTLPKFIPNNKNHFVIFIDQVKDFYDPWKGIELNPGTGPEMSAYLTKAVELKDRPIRERLRHCFEYLNSTAFEVSMDAYREFAKADYQDYRDLASSLPADKVAGWLQDPKTPAMRWGLYASFLGHCGAPEHALVLRKMLDDPRKRLNAGIDGMLAGYLMLLHKEKKADEGLKYLSVLLRDTEEDFLIRFTALKTLRFFSDLRGDVFPRTQILETACLGLPDKDLADFVIEELRIWQGFDDGIAKRVIDLFEQKSHDVPIVRRAILRYAIAARAHNNKRAEAFYQQQLRLDPVWVRETEEILRTEPVIPTTAPAK